MARLKARKRKRLPRSSFALPSKKLYPIHDKAHARAALAFSARKDTAGAHATVRRAVLKKYPSLKKRKGKR